MEEFRPIIVDALVLRVINRNIILPQDFTKNETPDEETFPREDRLSLSAEERPILFEREGMKKFLSKFEERVRERVFYPPSEQRLTYAQVIENQVRRMARSILGTDRYEAFTPW